MCGDGLGCGVCVQGWRLRWYNSSKEAGGAGHWDVWKLMVLSKEAVGNTVQFRSTEMLGVTGSVGQPLSGGRKLHPNGRSRKCKTKTVRELARIPLNSL